MKLAHTVALPTHVAKRGCPAPYGSFRGDGVGDANRSRVLRTQVRCELPGRWMVTGTVTVWSASSYADHDQSGIVAGDCLASDGAGSLRTPADLGRATGRLPACMPSASPGTSRLLCGSSPQDSTRSADGNPTSGRPLPAQTPHHAAASTATTVSRTQISRHHRFTCRRPRLLYRQPVMQEIQRGVVWRG